MSHDAIDELNPCSIGWVGESRLYYPNGTLQMQVAQPWAASPWGTGSHNTLAASVSNPPNAYGWRAPSPYSGSTDAETFTRINTVGAVLNDGVNWWKIEQDNAAVPGVGGSFSPVSWPSVAQTQAEARQKALLKFKDKKVDLSVAFLERKKTASLITDSVDALCDLAKDIRKRNFVKLGQDIADLWLAYRYGWTPTVLDAFGAVETLEKLDNGSYERYLVTARGKSLLESEVTAVDETYISQIWNLPAYRESQTRYRQEVKVRYDAVLTGRAYRKLSDVGVTDPLVTAWELLPYSFVVDWFLGVGDFLDGINALEGYSLLANCETVHRFYREELGFLPRTSGAWRSELITGGYIRERTEFTRIVDGHTPASAVVLKQEPLNLTRLFDSVALLSGLLTGKAHVFR